MASRVQEALRAAGIAQPSMVHQRARVEFTRMARALGARGIRRVGLLPARRDVAVPSVAMLLAGSLADLGGTAGVVDGMGSWPCAASLLREDEPGGRAAVVHWVTDAVALLTPVPGKPPLQTLRATLEREAEGLSQVLVDLTGFEQVGDHLAAGSLLDGVIVVARSGRTTLTTVKRWLHELPPARTLGVLVTGTR